jgi:hypothetical protein
MVRRRRVILSVAALAAAVSAGGVSAAAFIRSPAQAAADTAPPIPSVITAPVVQEVLRSTVVLRGTFSDGKTVSATPTSVANTKGSSASASLVVTGVFVHPGQKVGGGRALLEYSGRPVFALPGDLPVYRDLVPGESGKDVAQLQIALASLGFSTSGDTRGYFGAATKHAVTQLYTHMGYPVPVTGPTTQAAVQAAQGQVAASKPGAAAKASPTSPAGSSKSSGSGASSPVQLAQAESALAAAQAADGPMVPASEVVFVPSLPARVVSVPVSVGDSVRGPVLTLARGSMQLTGRLDPNEQSMVKPGMSAQVLSEITGAQARAVIESIGPVVEPGQQSAGGSDQEGSSMGGSESPYLPLIMRPVGSWPQALAGQDVRITLTAAASPGPVLAVPEAALTAGADGRTTVTVVDASGKQSTIAVATGISADGLVEVSPQGGGALVAGSRVVVGQ